MCLQQAYCLLLRHHYTPYTLRNVLLQQSKCQNTTTSFGIYMTYCTCANVIRIYLFETRRRRDERKLCVNLDEQLQPLFNCCGCCPRNKAEDNIHIPLSTESKRERHALEIASAHPLDLANTNQ